jgi:hypothetical protein
MRFWGGLTVIGQQLLCVFGQTVAPIAEAGVVVVVADARVLADAVYDLTGVQAMGGSVGVQFVEVGHANGQVGFGEELDSLGLGAVGEQRGDVLLDGALLEQVGEGFGPG